MRRGRVVTALIAGVLALGVGVSEGPPASACLIPCTATPKVSGTVLGGGIPGDGFSFAIGGMFRGVVGAKVVTKVFHAYGGGYYPEYGTVTLDGDSYSAWVSMTVVPGINGAPSLALVTIDKGPASTVGITGHITGQLGGTKSVGQLQIFSG